MNGSSTTDSGGAQTGAHGQTTWARWDPSTAGALIVLVGFLFLVGFHIAFRTDVAVKF